MVASRRAFPEETSAFRGALRDIKSVTRQCSAHKKRRTQATQSICRDGGDFRPRSWCHAMRVSRQGPTCCLVLVCASSYRSSSFVVVYVAALAVARGTRKPTARGRWTGRWVGGTSSCLKTRTNITTACLSVGLWKCMASSMAARLSASAT